MVLLTPSGRVELRTAQVHADRVCTGAGEARRQERRAAAELGDVEAANVAEQADLGLGQTEQPPTDPVRHPLAVRIGIREPFVHERPQVTVTGKVRSSFVHHHPILARRSWLERLFTQPRVEARYPGPPLRCAS